MSEWHAIGSHRYQVVAGIFRLETAGEFTAEQTHILIDALLFWQQREDECGALLDVSGGVGVPAETRRVMAQRSGEGVLPLPMAVVGAGLATRAVLTLMVNAIRLVLKKDVPLAFCKDDNEAIQWLQPKITERAARLRALRASATG
jgi:hypothetical protein